jgi:hypothetical protein
MGRRMLERSAGPSRDTNVGATTYEVQIGLEQARDLPPSDSLSAFVSGGLITEPSGDRPRIGAVRPMNLNVRDGRYEWTSKAAAFQQILGRMPARDASSLLAAGSHAASIRE